MISLAVAVTCAQDEAVVGPTSANRKDQVSAHPEGSGHPASEPYYRPPDVDAVTRDVPFLAVLLLAFPFGSGCPLLAVFQPRQGSVEHPRR